MSPAGGQKGTAVAPTGLLRWICGRRPRWADRLGITLPAVTDPAVAEALVSEAHRTCQDSNATPGNIGMALTVDEHGIKTTSEAVAA